MSDRSILRGCLQVSVLVAAFLTGDYVAERMMAPRDPDISLPIDRDRFEPAPVESEKRGAPPTFEAPKTAEAAKRASDAADDGLEALAPAMAGMSAVELRGSVSSTGVPGHSVAEAHTRLATMFRRQDINVRGLSKFEIKKDHRGAEFIEVTAKRPVTVRQRMALASRLTRKVGAPVRVVNPRAGGGVPGLLR